jgi:prepilin-type N-terminal cleavage/methylation domain-containing protein
MKNFVSRVRSPKACNRRVRWYDRGRTNLDDGARERGFTLVELLIVIVIIPLIVGALAYGLVAVLQLQSGVSNRLIDTEDAQVVSSTFGGDVQSAAFLTTQNSTTNQCGSGSQLLGLEWGQSPTTSVYENMISYMSQEIGTTNTYEMVRQYCTDPATSATSISSLTTSVPSTTAPVLVSSVVLSADLAPGQLSPTFQLSSTGTLAGLTALSAAQRWVPAADVEYVKLVATEPLTSYVYTLYGVPASSSTVSTSGTPVVTTNDTSCGFAQTGTGFFANNLCFVNFSSLTSAQMAVAESYNASAGVCGLETSVTVPGNFTMYFCLGLSNANTNTNLVPFALPTYGEAFLGNSYSGTTPTGTYTNVPFYIGVPGDPALYQVNDVNNNGGTSDVYLSDIEVVNAENVPATGWELVSIDAESTDNGESIVWSSNQQLSVLSNQLPWDSSTDPVGNACGANSSAPIVSNGLENSLGVPVTTSSTGNYQIECYGSGTTLGGVVYATTSSTKNGTAMIAATAPTSFQAQMVGTGLEAVSFGLLIAGEKG